MRIRPALPQLPEPQPGRMLVVCTTGSSSSFSPDQAGQFVLFLSRGSRGRKRLASNIHLSNRGYAVARYADHRYEFAVRHGIYMYVNYVRCGNIIDKTDLNRTDAGNS